MKHESDKRPVTLEDLLKLKRAERPSAEFWGEFDSQLRAKQLRALVEKRPWWHGLQTAFYSLGRYRLPIGAVAAVAVTLFVTRDRFAAQPVAQEANTMVAVAVAPAPASAAESMVASIAPVSVEHLPAARVSEQPEAEVAVAGAAAEYVAVTSKPLPRDEQSRVSAFQAFVGAGPVSEEETPSARFIASNLAAIQVSESMTAGLLAEPHGFESRGLPARAQEPLQQMAAPGESRRTTRYLAAMVSMNNVEPAPRTNERAASRLSQEELYDQVQRFGARRGGFNVKF